MLAQLRHLVLLSLSSNGKGIWTRNHSVLRWTGDDLDRRWPLLLFGVRRHVVEGKTKSHISTANYHTTYTRGM